MEFFAVNGKRPERLKEETRLFNYESLNHKYGLDTRKNPCVIMDNEEGFENLSPLKKYDAVIRKIAQTAPIRICKNEKISGAATLGDAIDHQVPARFQGKHTFYSVSHVTIDYETVIKKGLNYILEEAQKSLEKHEETHKKEFLESCIQSINSIKIWHQRYLEKLKNMSEYSANYENLKRVPFLPAQNFYEAVQSLWFIFAFVRLCGNWPGIGRIDVILGEYLEKDLKNGVITLSEAREILAHFFIKGCEWVCGGNYGSGDAQHYQNIVIGGIGEDGKDITNDVTYLVLDILEELGISDFPTTVRINKNTDRKLLERVACVIRLGGGVIAVYNEDLIIDSLVKYGYDVRSARKFANDGCWEIQVPGETFFSYIPFDSLWILQRKTLASYDENIEFSDYDQLYKTYIRDLKKHVKQLIKDRCDVTFEDDQKWQWKQNIPCTVISLFEKGCIEKGLSYREGGPNYNVVSPHIGGLPDTVNSLYAIKKLVFEDKKVSLSELMILLKNNWEGNEYLRQYALNKYTYFGNDSDEVDNIAKDIIRDFAEICDEISKNCGFKTPAGVSTFGRQLEWAGNRLATPYGKRAQEILSGNFSPAPGTDKEGATAVIRSYCKADLKRTVSGAALDIKLLPSTINGEKGIESIISLIKGFVELGGHFMQLDVADVKLLKEAQEHPENYQNLSVRVSGWNARFVTLNKEWQDMIIAQRGGDL